MRNNFCVIFFHVVHICLYVSIYVYIYIYIYIYSYVEKQQLVSFCCILIQFVDLVFSFAQLINITLLIQCEFWCLVAVHIWIHTLVVLFKIFHYSKFVSILPRIGYRPQTVS